MSILSNLLMVAVVVCLSAKYVSSIECFVCGSISEPTEVSVAGSNEKTNSESLEGSDEKAPGDSLEDSDEKAPGDSFEDSDKKAPGDSLEDSDEKAPGDSFEDSDEKAPGDSLEGSDEGVGDGSDEDSDKDATEVKGSCHKVNQKMIQKCSQDVCSILTLEKKNGEIVKVARSCGIPNKTIKKEWDDGMIEGELKTASGRTVAWSVCKDDLCNWGIMNKYQTITMFASAMLSLTFYYTAF